MGIIAEQDRMGNIHIWERRRTGREADCFLQLQSDIEYFLDNLLAEHKDAIEEGYETKIPDKDLLGVEEFLIQCYTLGDEFRKRAVPPSGRSYQRMGEDIDPIACLKAIARTSDTIRDEGEAVKTYGLLGEDAPTQKMRDAFLSAQKDEMRHKAMFEDVLKSLLQECVTVTRR